MLDSGRKRHRFRIVVPAYPAFNIYSRIARKMTAYGPVCVATAANKLGGWDVEVVDENNLGRFGPAGEKGADHELLQEERPADVVGFYGGLSSTAPRIYELAQFYRAAGAVTIGGGQHFAGENLAEGLRGGLDYVAMGEGERTIVEFLSAMETGSGMSEVKGLAWLEEGRLVQTPPREPIRDFDALPPADFSLVRYASISIYPVERVRGCGMDCEFCTVKGRPRCASPERLVEQIKLLAETRGAKKFFIVDDLFGQQRGETLRLCELLADYQQRLRVNFNITVQIRLDKARDSELLSAMRKAGVQTVAIGFESPAAADLEAMGKRLRADEMLELTRLYRQAGFLIHGMFIFGYPAKEPGGEKVDIARQVRIYRRFIRKSKIDTLQVLLPVPLPGTQLRRRLGEQRRLFSIGQVGWEYYDGNFPLFKPDDGATCRQMQWALRKLMGRFYRFSNMLLVVGDIMKFPMLALFLHDLNRGWRMWHRSWRNNTMRFGGWLVMRRWLANFKKDRFSLKLQHAQQELLAGLEAGPNQGAR